MRWRSLLHSLFGSGWGGGGVSTEHGGGGNGVLRRWLAGGDLEGRPALGASGGREEGRGALDFGIVGAEGGFPRRALDGHGDGGRRQ